ncbi:alpha-L-rhamnosidase [Halalkalibacter alkalisediminis]|uniref:alpha-L-rhamnosidase n=1 Tax=Halalkalibacter alkalisediminis TaxID=935616 RepID=A0ABV6NIL2_9BACI|nr:alpha-L-rhamnosidase [Halalkalibacter alkalisediminis]
MVIRHSFNVFLMFILLFSIVIPTFETTSAAESSTIENLNVEYMKNPVGIDSEKPRFSWNMKSTTRGAKQHAYEIFVAESEKKLEAGDYFWTSGKVSSPQSVHIKYSGSNPLEPGTRYHWNVKVWDQHNKLLESTENAYFETGLMSTDGKTNWEGAKWITDNKGETNPNVTLFRTEKDLNEKPIKSAQLFITSLGIYEAFINGEKVKLLQEDGNVVEETFNPGWTDYNSYVNYQAYDVTSYLSSNSKVSLGVMVGKGWFAGRIGSVGEYSKVNGKKLGLLAKMVITYEDGSKSVIVTDEKNWKSSNKSPILANDFYDGEVYDANIAQEIEGWNDIEFDESQWSPVKAFTYNGKVKGSRRASARIAEEYTQHPIQAFKYSEIEPSTVNGGESPYEFGHAVTMDLDVNSDITLKKGETLIIDMGQNMAGVPNMKVSGNAGTTVTMRFAEMLNDGRVNPKIASGGSDGPKDTLYRKALMTAEQTNKYILSGQEVEEYQPTFTFHGYRYMDIKADQDIIIKSVEGKVVTSVAEQTGEISTSNEDVNKLFNNVLWGQRSNYLSIPTDNPQRSERAGWTGDVQLFAQTAVYNYNTIPFLENYNEIMDSHNKDQNGWYGSVMPTAFIGFLANTVASGWSDAGIIVPWVLYQQTGDPTVIEKSFPQMDRYMDYIGANGYSTGLYGDWLAFEATSTVFLNTVYRAYDAQLMSKMAKAIGNESMVQKYDTLFQEVKSDFIQKYLDEEANLLTATADNFTVSRHGYPGADNAQTGLLWAIKLGLYETDNQKETMIENLTTNIKNEGSLIRPDQPENTLAVGFLGVNVLLPILSDIGSDELAYTLLLQDEMPSWLYSVKNGATTIWERWNSYSKDDSFGDSGMNSFNHYAYGAVVEWMYNYMAGISNNPDQLGFQNFVLQPTLDKEKRITWVNGSYKSVYGEMESNWKVENEVFTYEATVPANTTATLYLPAVSEKMVIEGKKLASQSEGVEFVKFENGKAVFELQSGSYVFHSVISGSEISTVEALENLLQDYISSGDVNKPLTNQLENSLKQVKHHLKKASSKQAEQHMNNFIKSLSHKEDTTSKTAEIHLLIGARSVMNSW